MRHLSPLLAVSLLLAGCEAALPVLDPPHTGCQIRAGYVVPEGSVSGGLAGTTVSGAGGAVTVIGECPPDLIVLTRTQSGGLVYHGPKDLLPQLLAKEPVPVPRDELEELMRRANGNEQ